MQADAVEEHVDEQVEFSASIASGPRCDPRKCAQPPQNYDCEPMYVAHKCCPIGWTCKGREIKNNSPNPCIDTKPGRRKRSIEFESMYNAIDKPDSHDVEKNKQSACSLVRD